MGVTARGKHRWRVRSHRRDSHRWINGSEVWPGSRGHAVQRDEERGFDLESRRIL